MGQNLTRSLAGHAARANSPESDAAFVERVLRGALVQQNVARAAAASAVLARRPYESRAWLPRMREAIEALAIEGLLPAGWLDRFPILAPGVEFRRGLLPHLDVEPKLMASSLAGTDFESAMQIANLLRGAVDAWGLDASWRVQLRGGYEWGYDRRGLGRYSARRMPAVTRNIVVQVVKPWEIKQFWNVMALARPQGGQTRTVFGSSGGGHTLENLAEESMRALGMAAVEALDPPWMRSRPAFSFRGSVVTLVLRPALVWRALARSGALLPPSMQPPDGSNEITWAEAPDPFGPAAELVALGLAPYMMGKPAGQVVVRIPTQTVYLRPEEE